MFKLKAGMTYHLTEIGYYDVPYPGSVAIADKDYDIEPFTRHLKYNGSTTLKPYKLLDKIIWL